MRVVYGILCLLMVLFVVVQYNDPDGPLWMAIYGIPAILAGVAAWRPGALRGGIGRPVAIVCLLLAVAGMIYYWPTTPGFWREEVWWNVETAREGMGMMIVTFVMLVVTVPVLMRRG